MARMDGWITIGTKLDNNQFDRDISKLEGKIEQEEQKQKLQIKANVEGKAELKGLQVQISELEQQYEEASQKAERFNELTAKAQGGIKLSYQEYGELKDLQPQVEQADVLGKQLDKLYDKHSKINSQIEKNNLAYNNSVNKVSELKDKVKQIETKRIDADMKSVKNNFSSAVSSAQNIGKAVTRTLLGIFGIRTALTILTRASSQLASYDDKYKADLDYIQFALVQVIAPVLRGIVSLMGTFLQYVNYIAQAWFGINLFSNASAKDFKSIKGSAEGIKKALQTTPFDEMNILNEDGSVSGGTDFTMPDFDLSKMEGEIPKWLDWIVRHKDKIIGVLLGIWTALQLIKFGLGGIKALGIGVMVIGIYKAIQSLIKYMKDPIWENFGGFIEGIGLAILGLGIAFLGLPVIITGVAVIILGIVTSYWDKIKVKLQEGIDWLKGQIDWVEENFGLLGKFMYENIISWLELVLEQWDSFFTNWKKYFNEYINFVKYVFAGDWQNAWETLKRMAIIAFDAIGEHFKNIFNFIKNIFVNYINTIIDSINTVINMANSLGSKVGLVIPKMTKLKVDASGQIVSSNTGAGSAVTNKALSNMGELIGQNVTIQANITNSMNGRILNKVLQQVQAQTAFAMNR